jgi:hypothetical protein
MAVDGTYETTVRTPMGSQAGKLELKTEGSVLTGSMQGMMGTDPIQNGTVNGDEIEFILETKSPMGPLKLTVKGKVDGDEISGQVTTPFGPAPLTGKRV